MTGFFVRICRAGKWQPVDVAEMTDDELDVFFDTFDVERARSWAKSLAKWIRDHVEPAAELARRNKVRP